MSATVEVFGNGSVNVDLNAEVIPVQDGTLLRWYHRTFEIGTSEEGGDPFIFQRCGTICTGQHPDHGVVFFVVRPGQKVFLEGKGYTLERRANDNLALVEIEKSDVQFGQWGCPVVESYNL
jgi:hypothetical protein